MWWVLLYPSSFLWWRNHQIQSVCFCFFYLLFVVLFSSYCKLLLHIFWRKLQKIKNVFWAPKYNLVASCWIATLWRSWEISAGIFSLSVFFFCFLLQFLFFFSSTLQDIGQGEPICDYPGELISGQRADEIVRTSMNNPSVTLNLLYVKKTQCLPFYFFAFFHFLSFFYLFFEGINPRPSDKNIGRLINAANPKLGQKANAKVCSFPVWNLFFFFCFFFFFLPSYLSSSLTTVNAQRR